MAGGEERGGRVRLNIKDPAEMMKRGSLFVYTCLGLLGTRSLIWKPFPLETKYMLCIWEFMSIESIGSEHLGWIIAYMYNQFVKEKEKEKTVNASLFMCVYVYIDVAQRSELCQSANSLKGGRRSTILVLHFRLLVSKKSSESWRRSNYTKLRVEPTCTLQ